MTKREGLHLLHKVRRRSYRCCRTVTPQWGNDVLSPPFCKGYISISISIDVAIVDVSVIVTPYATLARTE